MATQTINSDTIKLLRECNAGVKMGIDSINEVLPDVKSDELRDILIKRREEHERLGQETRDILNDYGDSGKEPSSMASGMSWLKTTFKLTMDPSDSTVADLMSDGCSMGIKSIRKYLNEYKAAEEKVKSIATRLIVSEEGLIEDIKKFL
ncbi:MAG: hypothetical protein IIZ59_02825 [Clostridia bacterium]|nr:hypothetical protein [Clostridia bacterium]